MTYGENANFVEPPADLLPSEDERQRYAALLDNMPGIDIIASAATGAVVDAPADGYQIQASIRPGFNGVVAISPYREIKLKLAAAAKGDDLGSMELRGNGTLYMVYENPRHIIRHQPKNRLGPDYAPFSVGLGQPAEDIRLQNGGRLLLPSNIVTTLGQGTMRYLYRSEASLANPTIRTIEHIAADADELRQVVGALASAMALEGEDHATFVEQPFRKIRRLMPPEPPKPAPPKPSYAVKVMQTVRRWTSYLYIAA